ncbi:hypothetical protein TWF594_000556 [Orbilia oligospora]|nr:hypothetical protein TWF594_000556 [Orbilia oligospora]
MLKKSFFARALWSSMFHHFPLSIRRLGIFKRAVETSKILPSLLPCETAQQTREGKKRSLSLSDWKLVKSKDGAGISSQTSSAKATDTGPRPFLPAVGDKGNMEKLAWRTHWQVWRIGPE